MVAKSKKICNKNEKQRENIADKDNCGNDGNTAGNGENCQNRNEQFWFWVVAAIVSGSASAFERRRQFLLTQPPQIFCQSGNNMDVYKNVILQSLMSASFLRSPRPTLFLGTRAFMNSTWAYLKRAPKTNTTIAKKYREIMKMSHDNANIAIDWEFPRNDNNNNNDDSKSHHSLVKPVVLIVHGINTDASFGYIRSLMSSCSSNGWIAAGMNLRGYGNIDITTPRLANMAFTNDLRDVVNKISTRLAPNTSLFLVGFSLGANIVVKYLGEEGMAHTLPKCVVGAVSLGNPFKYKKLDFPMDLLINLGSKKQIIQHLKSLRKMTSKSSQQILNDILFWKWNMSKINGIHSHMLRNNPSFPFETTVGYQDEEHYAKEVGSYQYAPHVNIPLLVLVASDDDISYQNTLNSLPHLLSNPNIIVLKSKTGGHLGWHTSTRNNPFHVENWGDITTTRFIQSILDLGQYNSVFSDGNSNSTTNSTLRMLSRL